ncbi:hypothetical protein D9M71_760190 [compost metagenome]
MRHDDAEQRDRAIALRRQAHERQAEQTHQEDERRGKNTAQQETIAHRPRVFRGVDALPIALVEDARQ